MTKLFLRGLTFIILAALFSGCATGKTDFKVISASPTPAPTPIATPTAVLPQKTPEVIQPVSNESSEEFYNVVAGDCLWTICETLYGDPWQYRQVAQKNSILNPDLIEPGQKLLLISKPELDKKSLPSQKVKKTKAKKAVLRSEPSPEATVKTPLKEIQFPDRPNRAFGPGERLHFSVEYFGISAGYATLFINQGPEMNGRETLHIVAEARTHPAFEWIFKVRDRIESFVDSRSIFSWRYEKHLREGNYSNDSFMIYDQINQKVIKDKGRTEIDAPPMVQDVLSEFYFYRTLDQGIGDKTTIPVLADDGKRYEVLVKVVRQEKVKVPAGEFDCLVVEPYLKFEGVFKHQGKIHIWLTNDERRVPVLIKSGIIIGTIDIVLRDAVVVDVSDN